MSWKQPIPVEIPELKHDKLLQTVFQHILLRCTNENRTVNIGGESINLKRGQCIFGRKEFAEELGCEHLKVYRKVIFLQKVNNWLNIWRHRYCSVIEVKNYNEWVEMNNSMNNWRTSGEHLVNTNKSDKSDKSDKNKKINNKKRNPKVTTDTQPPAIPKGMHVLGGKLYPLDVVEVIRM